MGKNRDPKRTKKRRDYRRRTKDQRNGERVIRPMCRRAVKVTYESEKAAEKDMQRAIEQFEHMDGPKPVRAYQCECGGWHLTSWETPEGPAVV